MSATLDEQRQLSAVAVRAAHVVKDMLPSGVGCAVFLFDFGEGGRLCYVSTAERSTMIRAVREWLDRQERLGDG